jgi:hypothetical protein
MIMKLRSLHGSGRVRSGLTLLVLAWTALVVSPSATAQRMQASQDRGGHHFNRVPGNKISGFRHRHGGPLRNGGHFIHGHHHGQFGWWWVDGGLWYPYLEPVYPYATPYAYSDEPPVAMASPPPEIGPATQSFLFCDALNAYYPNVKACPGEWRQVQVPLKAVPVPQY